MQFTLNSVCLLSSYFSVKQNIFILFELNWDIYSFCFVSFFTIFSNYTMHFWFPPYKFIDRNSLVLIFPLTIHFFVSWIKKTLVEIHLNQTNHKKFFINIFTFYFIIETVCISKQYISIKVFLNKIVVKIIH